MQYFCDISYVPTVSPVLTSPHSPFSIGMRGGNHLWKVVHGDSIILIEHQVKLVEVSVYEAVIGQLYYQLHTLVVHSTRVLYFSDLLPRTKEGAISALVCV